ncbi:hypothetical protein B0A52_01064 [Exophiala mesophila]|uniref:Zn(2)-C6 fungal-type domain-containing protein n=1 Tax=Exophiala mesophila TaxID=212818 RepID=A0A438NGE4_EXOME|nr:hypothetical protein B0A52_01064 [Exophiala mesophila]
MTDTAMNQTPGLMLPMKGDGPLRFLGPRRARAACNLCRVRKVRCDARDGRPCFNCTFENVQCILMPKRSRRKTPHGTIKKQNTLKPVIPAKDVAVAPEPPAVKETAPHEVYSNVSPLSNTIPEIDQSNTDPAPITLDSLLDGFGTGPFATNVDKMNWQTIDSGSISSSLSPNQSSSWTAGVDVCAKESWETPALPRFVKPIPDHLPKEDIEYLQRKGALSIPEPDLRAALLRSFIEYVHPTLPILQLQDLLDILQDNSPTNERISLPLFQAIMFAGAPWVDIKLFRRLGYLTRKAARRALYLKARLLYDSDYEEDRLAVVQTVVLLTLWWEGPNEQKDGWYWSGVAISVARSIGLNRDSHIDQQPARQRRLRRRLWWCCVMRDVIASLGLNRPLRLKESDFDVTPLTLDDFEIVDYCGSQALWLCTHDASMQEQLAKVCIEMVAVCKLLRRVVEVAYIETASGHISIMYDVQTSHSPEKVSTSNIRQPDLQTLESVEREISAWRCYVSHEVLHASPTPDDIDQVPYLHRAIVTIMYQTCRFLLHRSKAQLLDQFNLRPTDPKGISTSSSRAATRAAAAEVNKIAMDLYKADLVKYLHATGISCLVAVGVSHVLDLRLEDPVVRQKARQRLEESKQVLRELSDAHIAADWAINFLTFMESEVQPQDRPRRRQSGMIVGKIQWADKNGAIPIQRAQKGIRGAEALPEEQSRITTSSETQDLVAGTEALDSSISQTTPVHSTTTPVEMTASMTQWLHQSPMHFPDLINFPESWLDLTDTQGAMAGVDWIGDCSLNMDLV